MTRKRIHWLGAVLTLATLAGAIFGSIVVAGPPGCARCGRAGVCHKVCRLVCEERKVNVTCWGCKCEEFCLPGLSHRGCKHCEDVCEQHGCADDGVHSRSQPFVWFDWIPGCSAGVATKKKLMKKTVVKTLPSYRWVAEELCAACSAECERATPPRQDASVPPPPPGAAKIVFTPPQ